MDDEHSSTTVTVTPSTPLPTVAEYVIHDIAASNRDEPTSGMPIYPHPPYTSIEGITAGIQPSFVVFLTGPTPQFSFPGREGTNMEDLFADEYNPLTSSLLSLFSSADSSLLNMSPLSRTLGELSIAYSSPTIPFGDRSPSHQSPEEDPESILNSSPRHESLPDEASSPLLPNLRAFSSAPPSPLIFATSSDGFDSPENQDSLLLHGDNELINFTTPDRTVEVGSLFDNNGYSPFRPASLLTTSSEGTSGSSPFFHNSAQLSHLSHHSHHSSPDTDYGSNTWLRVPTDAQFCDGEDSIANNSEPAATAPYPRSNLPVTALSQSSTIHATEDYPLSAAVPAIPGWIFDIEHGQAHEPNSFAPPTIQSNIESMSSLGNLAITRNQIASEASQAASARRRTKDPKYSCTFCTQRLTSRDNLRSHEDAHRGIKRFPCEYCPDRLFRTRAVLKRHQRCTRCAKAQLATQHNKS